MSDLPRACAKMFCAGFTGTTVPVEMRALIARGVGGAVFFKRNFTSGQQFTDLCADLKQIAGRPFLTCLDHEGGRVNRLGLPFTQIPSMRAIGQRANSHLARDIGRLMARELRAANIDMDLAPILDVDTNPANPVIGDRSFGRSPQLVSEIGVALIDGLQQESVAACGKHFPGHGDTSQDSHRELPRLAHALGRLNEIELPPFKAAVRAGVAAIMTAHVIFEAIEPTLPATMSKPVLTGLLRERLGFNGLIVSDDLEMKAIANHFGLEEVIVRSANAGVDLFMFAHSVATQNQAIDILIQAVERGDVPREKIASAGRRLDELFERFVRPARSGPLSEVVGCEEHRSLVEMFSGSSIGIDPTDDPRNVVA